MLQYPDINPVAIELGPLTVHWYGITYLFAFLAGWWLAKYRASQPGSGWKEEEIGDVVFYIVLGVIFGGKLGSVFFYQTEGLLSDPLHTLNPVTMFTEGGMSFHGGFIGVLVAFFLYARNTGRSFFQVADFIAPAFPIGLGAGRVGNFINGELWGRPTDVPWGMVFPHVDQQARHPNQIYQFIGEGIILFLVVWMFSRKPRPTMAVSGVFALTYGIYRFLIEFVREPDDHLGFVALEWLTMGQILSLPMILAGLAALYFAYRGYDGGAQVTAAAPAATQATNSVTDSTTTTQSKKSNNKTKKKKSGRKK